MEVLIESRNEKKQRVNKFQAAMDSDEGVEKTWGRCHEIVSQYFFANVCIYKSAMNTRTVVIG